jgi:hypothetical protein
MEEELDFDGHPGNHKVISQSTSGLRGTTLQRPGSRTSVKEWGFLKRSG